MSNGWRHSAAAGRAHRRETLYRLAETAAHSQERIDLGIAACAQLLADEPEREEVHRLKMRLLALAGQRTAALKQYDECTAALLDELGVPPSAETNALYDQIMAGEVGPPSSTATRRCRCMLSRHPSRHRQSPGTLWAATRNVPG